MEVEDNITVIVSVDNCLLECNERYDGENDVSTLESFITGVSLFNLLHPIQSDEKFAQDFGLLLKDRAYQWWVYIQGYKSRLSWHKIKRLLRIMFINKMPEFLIYNIINHKCQKVFETAHYFIAYKICLFENLPKSYSEIYKVNKISNQLRKCIREQLPLNIDSFLQLFNALNDLNFDSIEGLQSRKRKANFDDNNLEKRKRYYYC